MYGSMCLVTGWWQMFALAQSRLPTYGVHPVEGIRLTNYVINLLFQFDERVTLRTLSSRDCAISGLARS
jgi:hypothetical protein